MNLSLQTARALTRRQFFSSSGLCLGGIALSQLMGRKVAASTAIVSEPDALRPTLARPAPLPGRARAIIYLHMSGAPPALDLYDYKPELKRLHMQPCPDSFLKNQRFAFIKGVPKMLGPPHPFRQSGQSGGWFSTLIPHIASVADDICVVRSMWTDQFNHAPAELFLFTGNMRAGQPSLGSWLTYGLGSENQD